MRTFYQNVAVFLTLSLASCADRLSQEEFIAAYDSGDHAYVHGTIQEAEAAQLRFYQLSQRALAEDSKFVNAERTLWLASVRLYDIYCNMDQEGEAERFLTESYHYRGDDEEALTFVEYGIQIEEFIEAMDAEALPRWKDSNKPSEVTAKAAPPL